MSEHKPDIDSLIGELTDDLSPVKSLFSPIAVIAPWVIISFAYLAGVVHFLGIRMDVVKKLDELPFVFELSLTALISLSAAYSAGHLAIPDMKEKSWLIVVPSTLLAVAVLWISCLLYVEGFHLPALDWHHCFSDAMLMGFVPVATLSVLVRKGATTRPGMMAFMSTLSAGGLGWAALRMTCMGDHTGHLMVFHFLPFIFLAAVLGMLARRLYSW